MFAINRHFTDQINTFTKIYLTLAITKKVKTFKEDIIYKINSTKVSDPKVHK